MSVRFGRNELPEPEQRALRRAIRLEWFTIVFLAVAIAAVYLVMGSSQAMRAAWIEDILSLAPPIAFLIAVRIVRKPPSKEYPYGHHRSVGVAHLVGGVALLAMGLFLIVDSGMGLITAEHPPIGTIQLFGHQVWLGWIMMIVMALTIPLPIWFGHAKMKLAKQLHDKVLYADADMNKADWMTATGTIVGVAGVGIGWWWSDSAVAILIGASIFWDGFKNMKAAITDLVDARATTFDDSKPHPLTVEIEELLRGIPWIAEAGVRTRDQGHVMHVEAFIVPRGGRVSVRKLRQARDACLDLDWKAQDIVLIPVDELPAEVGGGASDHQSERNQ